MKPEGRYAELTHVFLGRPNVTQEGKGFGSSALKVNRRIFAMLTSRSQFVVKLPSDRVHELITSGQGRPYDAGKGRPMKEWVVIPPDSGLTWTSLAEEALTFVGGETARG
jgi:hypothetical protein